MSIVPSSAARDDVTGPTEAGLDHLAHVAVGSQRSFARLYDEFAPMVHGISTRVARSPEEAETITLDTFVFLWRHAARLPSHADVCRIAGVIAVRTARSAPIRTAAEDGSHG